MTDIDELQARGDLFTRQLVKEKQRVGTLNAQLADVNSKIAMLRETNKQKAIQLLNKYTTTPNDANQRIDGCNPTLLAETSQAKAKTKLEKQLGKALLRRNQIENDNNAIKEKIDKLRRKVHNDVKNKETMEKELHEIQDNVDEIMKRSAAVATERERLHERRNLKIDQDNEKQAMFEKEYRELSVYIADQAKKLEQSISQAANNVTTQLANVNSGIGASNTSVDSKEDVKPLQAKLAKVDAELPLLSKSLRENQWKIHHFEEKIKQLREVSGLSSTEDIINTFVKNEDECFSIFNYIQAVNLECDKTIEFATKVRQDVDMCRQEQMEAERARSATMNVYRESLHEVQQEREQLYATAIEGRRTIETIARRVTALYFKLQCQKLDQDKHTSKNNSLPPQLQSDRKLTTIGGGEVSERNILKLLELIETRSIQIVDAYLNQLSTTKQTRRPSLILSPQMFERASFARHPSIAESDEGTESDDEESSSSSSSDDDDEEGFGRPMSVSDIRREAKAQMKESSRPNTSSSVEKKTKDVQLIASMPRHTVA